MASVLSHVQRSFGVAFVLLLLFFSRASSHLIQLNEDNWQQMLNGEWMVEFFAPWCPACKALDDTWREFAEWSNDLDIKVAQVDVTAHPGLSGRFMVTALPTIYHVFNGQFRQYRGSRDKDSFITFIEDKKWESIEEISAWKSPNSIQMSLISHFFKLSMVLRSVHTKLIEEYGIPYWGSYLIFALATILIGAILGLILVCIIDFVFPPKTTIPPTPRSDISFATSSSSDIRSEENEDTKSNASQPNKSEVSSTEENFSEESKETSTATDEVRKRRLTRKDE